MQYLNRGSQCQSGSWTRRLRCGLSALADAWLPQQCLLCGGPGLDASICPPCRSELPPNGPACQRCAIPLSGRDDRTCGACQKRPGPWRAVHAPLVWTWPVDRLVKRLKYHRRLAVASGLGQVMVERLGTPLTASQPLLIPVPLHWTRLQQRGFNQAEELGRVLSGHTGFPFQARQLVRTRRTPSQTGLSATDRRRNLRRAFAWRGKPLHGAEVWLVDDVFTTGATATACARVLKRAGASAVVVWVAARAA